MAAVSKALDAVRARERKAQRLDRLDRVLDDLKKLNRLRREGLPMEIIAARMGWHPHTLERWLKAAAVFERKGIKMSQSNSHP